MSDESFNTDIHGLGDAAASSMSEEFVTVTIADQLFGIPVLMVQDVLGPQRLTSVPLSPGEVAGVLNLRGRIVTAIDVRSRLGLPPSEESNGGMNVVVDYDGELYSLTVDAVGEVIALPKDAFEGNPSTLDPAWRAVSRGVYRMEGSLLIDIDVDRLIGGDQVKAA